MERTERLRERYEREGLTPEVIGEFQRMILERYASVPRLLPWRDTADPYCVLVSEVMLQQTQAERVRVKYEAFIARFSGFAELAAASLTEVLEAWQGLGYNRRGISLKRAAEEVMERFSGKLPSSTHDLATLPGIGPYTAGAIASFAFGVPAVFIETNIRAVFIHFFFHDREGITDREILPLVEATLYHDDPATWYNALMDYGVMLKKEHGNPARKSRHHVRQSPFKGSNRELRAHILRLVLAEPGIDKCDVVREAGREPEWVVRALGELEREGFIRQEGKGYRVT